MTGTCVRCAACMRRGATRWSSRSTSTRPHVSLLGLAAGFHAVAHLAADASEASVVAGASDRSIGLYGMSSYRPSGRSGPPQLVLGFGNLGEVAIQRGIAAIGDLL